MENNRLFLDKRVPSPLILIMIIRMKKLGRFLTRLILK